MEQAVTTLTQIYNTMGLIDTHGEGTIKMALCLDALNKTIQDLNNLIPTLEKENCNCETCDCDK